MSGERSKPARRRRNPFFGLAVLFSALFVVTILALLATALGDPQTPAARLVDRFANRALAAEVLAILVTGGLALAIDRRQQRPAD